MPKCPYCDAELEIKLSIKPVPIEDTFKNEATTAMEGYFDVMMDTGPFGTKILKSFGKRALKWQKKFLDGIAALPLIVQSCENCDAVIGTSLLFDIGSIGSFNTSS